MSDAVSKWLQASPYSDRLGAQLEALSESEARLRLPYKDENSNPGQVLHGGVAASMIALAGQAVGRKVLGKEAGPWHTAALQVSYLAAAKASAILAVGRLLRRGKSLCFVEVDVQTEDGKPIAHGSVLIRGRFSEPDATLPRSRGDDGAGDPGPMGPHIGRVPFIQRLGMTVEHMTDAHSRIAMPRIAANLDADGNICEGATLALLDTTGAMAAWAHSGPGPYKASTPGMQAQILGPAGDADLVGFGRSLQRDGEMFWSEVEVARKSDQALVARGTVVYRIVVPG